MRNIFEGLRRKSDKAREPVSEEERLMRKSQEKGRKYAIKRKFDQLLSLRGHDVKLLHHLLGLKLFYIELDKSKETKYGKFLYTKETYKTKVDTPETTKLRTDINILERSIDGFVQEHYQGAENRAWSIRLAVNDLFSRPPMIRNNPTEINRWAERWKPQLTNPQPSTAQ
ncbi:MAG: hypothetical protein AAB521_00260 [Patescibacteria group bacterium]